MKRSFSKIFAIVICLILICSSMLAFYGCKNGSTDEQVNIDNTKFTDGVHQYNYTETNFIVSENGISDYSIVIADDAGEYVKFAAKELNLLFFEATGSRLRTLKESETDYSSSSKYFVLGKNGLFDAAGLSTDGLNLDRNGFIIKTVDNSVFIAGDTDDATMFGVYGYLELEFGFDCFSNTSYVIEKKNVVNLRNYDVIDIPDIKVRSSGNSYITDYQTTLRRMRYTPRDAEIFVGDPSAHTAMTYLPTDTYNNMTDHPESYHPKWYAASGQLCYTANGDAEELALMKDTVFEIMKDKFKSNRKGYIFIFSQMDIETWCSCATCAESKAKYGTDSAVVVKFINDLCVMMEEWMETEEGKPYKREFLITFLAYHLTTQAPAKYDESKGEYVPIDDSVICHDRAAALFTPIYMDYQQSIYSETNKSYYEAFQGWRAICKTINIYTYETNYGNYLVPFDVFNQLEDFYNYAAMSNTYWIFSLGQRGQTAGATGWQVFKSYVITKLSWNVRLNIEDLTEKFFKGYFGPASESMLEYWRSYRVHSQYLIDNYLAGGRAVYAPLLKVDYWPRNVLADWLDIVDKAMEDINYLKVADPEKYQEYYDHIAMERVFLYYAIVELHASKFDAEFINKIKLECKEDCTRLGITKSGEGNRNSTIQGIWTKWGV